MRNLVLGLITLTVAVAVAWLVWGADGSGHLSAFDQPPPAEHVEPAAPLQAHGGAADGGAATAAIPAPELERTELPVDMPPPRVVDAGTGRLLGTVRWADDESPVPGLALRLDVVQTLSERLRAPSTRSAPDGRFVFEDVPATTYLLVSALGGTERVTVAGGGVTEVDLLVPRGTPVEGLVVDENARPVADAAIWLSERNAHDFGEVVARSDAEGRFAIASVDGSRWIGARARGYRGSAISLVERGKASRRLELTLVRGDARVRGFVRGPEGQPRAGAAVLAQPRGEADWRLGLDGSQQRTWVPVVGRSDEQGAFALEGLPPGELVVCAHAPGCGKASTELLVATGGVGEVVLDLTRAARVHGCVTDAGGEPVRRAFLAFARGEIDSTWAICDEAGRFETDVVSPGEVAVEVWVNRSPALTTKLVLSPGETREWNPVLGRSGALRGTVVDSRNAPLAGFSVAAFRETRGIGEVKTDADGRFVLEDLDATPLTLRVGVQPEGGKEHARLTVLVVEQVVPPREDLTLVVPDERLPSVTVRGRVLRADGSPAAGATLVLGGADGEVGHATAVVDPAGDVRLARVLPGDYWVTVQEPQHPTLHLGRREFAARADVDLGEIRLTAGGRIAVTPRLAPGVGEGELEITVVDEAGRHVGKLQRAGATYRSPVVPSGGLTLVIAGAGVARSRHEVQVDAGRETSVDLFVERGLKRTVRARLPADAAVPRWVWGTVFGPQPGQMLGGGGLRRADDGTWSMDVWLPPADCTVVVGAEGQKLRGEVVLAGSLPDGASVAVDLVAR